MVVADLVPPLIESRRAMNQQRSTEARLWQADLVYSAILLAGALVFLAMMIADAGYTASGMGYGAAGFFLVFGLFAIATGFPHPVFGHVSFDRVAQVASILVLGPVDAAWVNGLASFIYPWHRLWRGVPVRTAVTAALHNSGLMIFVILGSGLLYERLGGAVPLEFLDLRALTLVLVLVIIMQIVNDIGMMVVVYLRDGDPRLVFSGFTAVVEYISGAAGVVLAIAFNNESVAYFVLLVIVLAIAMLVIMQYALMRYRLEMLVEERTEELKVQAEKFERQATHDKLTGLPNRRHADNYLQQQIDLTERSKQASVVALADVDHFKRINDSYSHAAGDRVLERVASILKDGCRKSDFVSRYGGEEFLLYFPDTGMVGAQRICDQLRLAIQDAGWSDIAPGLGVTISLGLAEIAPGARRRTVLNSADQRLYRAKNEGRNRVVAT